MPAQDKEKEAVKSQEILDDTVAHKSETLLPVLNFVYENQMNKLDDLQGQKAEVQDGIGRNEGKIAVLQEKAERLEATNTMLRELMDTEKLPKAAMTIVKANEAKIASIHEKQIPKLENGIEKAKSKTAQLESRMNIGKLKSEKLRSFSNVIRSFTILNPQKRRDLFRESMNSFRESSKGLLEIERNGRKDTLAKLSQQYEAADSMAEKFKLGQKIDAVKVDIASVESKIHKLENAPSLEEASDHAIDQTIAKTEAEVENFSFAVSGDTFEWNQPLDSVVFHVGEYLHDTEMELENDLIQIDKMTEQERPDVPLFLEEIDFSTCDDAALQAFRDSAKANTACASAIGKAINASFDYEKNTANSGQALDSVQEQFSDDRIAYVLANALNGTSDGRVSQEIKDFAKDRMQSVPQQYQKKHLFLDSANSGLVNLFAKTFLKSQDAQEIQKPTPVKEEAKKSSLPQKRKTQTRSHVRKINPEYYLTLTKAERVINNEPAKVGAMIMATLEKQKIPFSAVETKMGLSITVSKENEKAFKTAESKARDTHVRLVHPEVFKEIPKDDRIIQTMPEDKAQKAMQRLEKDGIAYSARLNGEKSAVTVRKSEAPVYFKRNQIKKLAQEAKDEKSDPSKTKAKSKGQEIG